MHFNLSSLGISLLAVAITRVEQLKDGLQFKVHICFRYDYDDPDFQMVTNLNKMIVSGQGPFSPLNFFPAWLVKLISKQVYLSIHHKEKNKKSK